jgi:2-oxoisovalerate dehydrogenase E1 component alpha subunit
MLRHLARLPARLRALPAPLAARALASGKKAGKAGAAAVAEEHEDAQFPGARTHFTTDMAFTRTTETLPCFRVMNERGEIVAPAEAPDLDDATLLRMYETMVQLQVMDDVLLNAQRHGRTSFSMSTDGEEGLLIGCAAALDDTDTVFAQYREAGVLLWRGFGVRDVMNQCLSNDQDIGKGRQMPLHFGSPAHHFQTISSPLATQIPQAAGAAFAQRNLLDEQDKVVAVFFGEGAASEGDFHAAINFASTLDCPTLFMCRNNGFAISTPAAEQFRGDGIGGRGPAYAVDTIRVDGNDVFAVYAAVRAAREFAVANSRPVLIETMSYRLGSHSTSDDASRYRDEDEVSYWRTNRSPIGRLRAYIEARGIWGEEQEARARAQTREEVVAALNGAERRKKPALAELFTDVYDELPPALVRQQQELKEHLAKHGDKYDLDAYASKDL